MFRKKVSEVDISIFNDAKTIFVNNVHRKLKTY